MREFGNFQVLTAAFGTGTEFATDMPHKLSDEHYESFNPGGHSPRSS